MAFEELGYADAGDLLLPRLRAAQARRRGPGGLPLPGLACPTPLAPISAFVAPEHQARLEPVYEDAAARGAGRILAGSPPTSSRIQWDTSYEFGMLEGASPSGSTTSRAASWSGCSRLRACACRDVQLGYHLCYGDERAPATSRSPRTRASSSTSPTRSRPAWAAPLNWIHMPVPRERDDDGLLRAARRPAPARGDRALPRRGPPHGDGVEGTRRRIAAARAASCRASASPRNAAGAAARRRRSRAARAAPRAERAASRMAARRAHALPRGPPASRASRTRTGRSSPSTTFGLRYDTRRHPRLVPQPRPHGRGPGAPSGGRRPPARLLRRHGHPARPPESAGSSTAASACSSSTLGEVPARRAREVRGRPARGACGCCAGSRTSGGCSSLDEVLGLEFWRARRLASTNAIHLYPDLADTLGSLDARAAAGRRASSSARAISATRAPSPPSGSWTRRSG